MGVEIDLLVAQAAIGERHLAAGRPGGPRAIALVALLELHVASPGKQACGSQNGEHSSPSPLSQVWAQSGIGRRCSRSVARQRALTEIAGRWAVNPDPRHRRLVSAISSALDGVGVDTGLELAHRKAGVAARRLLEGGEAPLVGEGVVGNAPIELAEPGDRGTARTDRPQRRETLAQRVDDRGETRRRRATGPGTDLPIPQLHA